MSRLFVLAAALSCAPAFAQSVFINEFHYDNSGTDSGERVEVIGPSGTSLTGWKVLAYDGGGASYASFSLSGTLANQCGGFGTATVTATGLQNGAPDGLALVNSAGTVVQFLSYEGSFTATSGSASGRTSVDIGKAETADTPIGQSLQLSGTGTQYSNFVWNAPRSASFGACNTGQSFTQPDAAPTVVGTNPAGGAISVATSSNISVNFSEAVTVTGAWYGISCSASGNKTATVSGSGTSYTLDPSSDFTSLETCTVTLNAASITDVDGTPTPMSANYSFVLKMAAATTGYYGTVNSSTAAGLRSSLHNVIDDHTKISYSGIWQVIDKADENPMDSTKILDLYKNASYTKVGAGNNFYNREHIWPKSLGFPNDGATNLSYSDAHHLMACDITYNSNRGNLPFGNCTSGCTEYPTQINFNQGGGSGVFPGNSNWSDGSIWQTWKQRKGDTARAIFYMDLRYEGGTHGTTGAAEPDLRLTDTRSLITQSTGNASVAYMGLLSALLQWHIEDPVDERELLRNEVAFGFQKNRNPFIDHPEWVKCIYQSVCN